MNTPLYDAVKLYIDKNTSRMHMPGHKGKMPDFLSEAAPFDITEVRGADSLYECEDAILHTELEYTKLYGSSHSFLSASGSTLCIQAMLAALAKDNGAIICSRNVHISAVNAMALLSLSPVWLYPSYDAGEGLPGRISPTEVEKALSSCDNPCAVFITSPDYFGVISDIYAIKEVCKKHNVPLLVDNAHGSHLRFLSEDLHPISQGADACSDSLHKTMPVLTGGALLHTANAEIKNKAKSCMSIFGSTSPSYLIMLSADMNVAYIKDSIKSDLEKIATWVKSAKEAAKAKGFALPQGICDPTRLSLGFYALGYSKEEFLKVLDSYNIEHEYISDNYCVLLPSAQNSDKELNSVMQMIKEISIIGKLIDQNIISGIKGGESVMSPREALLADKELVTTENCVGRIAAQVVSRCPPGIPLTVYGEKIDENVKNSLFCYGIPSLFVVK